MSSLWRIPLSKLFQSLVISIASFHLSISLKAWSKDLEGSDSASLQKEADWWNLTSSMSSSRITQTTGTLKWILDGKNILGLSGDSDLFPYPAFIRTYQNLPPHNFVGTSRACTGRPQTSVDFIF